MCIPYAAKLSDNNTIPTRRIRKHKERRKVQRTMQFNTQQSEGKMSNELLSLEDPLSLSLLDQDLFNRVQARSSPSKVPPENGQQIGLSEGTDTSPTATSGISENPVSLPSNRIPTPPPLPPTSALSQRRQTSSSGKTPMTNGSSSDSEGRHICSNGISYPPLDELLKFGRVNRSQLNEVEQHFNSDQFHCISHLICEGIYHISNVSKSDHLVIEDFIPLARNDFSAGLQDIIERHLRSRQIVKTEVHAPPPGRTRAVKETPLRRQAVKIDSRPSASEGSERSYDLSIDLPEQFLTRRQTNDVSRFSDELSSPVRQRILRAQVQAEESEPETVKPRKGSSSRSFKPSKDLNKNMASAIEICSLPQTFIDLRLTFLHYIHQSLYSLHLRSHVKTQSYPKPDILELLIIGRDLCDQRNRYKDDIRHPQLLKLFLRETFSRRSRKIKSNCFQVPMLTPGHSMTHSLALEAFSSFHRQYQVEWNKQFGQMITPSFI